MVGRLSVLRCEAIPARDRRCQFRRREQKTMRIPEALVKQVYEHFTTNSELDPRAVSGGTAPKARSASLSRARFGVRKDGNVLDWTPHSESRTEKESRNR